MTFPISNGMSDPKKEVQLEVLTSFGCAHCHEFLKYWESIKGDWANVSMKEVSLLTPEGQLMAGKYMLFASPGIVMNNKLYFSGSVNKKDFLRELTALTQ